MAMSEAAERAVALFRQAGADPEGSTIEDLRDRDERLWARFIPDDAIVEPVDAGGVPSLWVSVPGGDPGRVVVWFHGGGFTVGSAASRTALGADIARAAGCRVLLPGYRLSPEHAFPAPVEDALAAYRWVSDLVGAGNVVLGGDSAGGGLAVVTMLAAREQGLPLPAGAVPVSAAMDWTFSAESHRTSLHLEPVVTGGMYRKVADDYLRGHDPRDPLVSPLFGDLRGLPPALLLVGGDETLLDDSRNFAAAAREAGCEVDLKVYEGMFHYWHLFASFLPEGRDAVAAIAAFTQARTGR
ncbi:alpha/beta hydrolase [Actinomadura rugatobispora]|uniref:Alpha/beta hydrolase n=1 Tax=Actinomadura rugatobispora TaxID=1994 RepID=A0ABW0ZW29_9ACTN|nr:alpha/beta hydrolase [Actinomadura rugatobispora]